MSSSEPEGLAYLETSNLDGESNLKLRTAPSKTCDMVSEDSLSSLRGTVKCELPNAELYHFEGTLKTSTFTVSLDQNNLLPRGAVLRNAAWIAGLVVYTGHESRIMMNANKDEFKITKFERKVNGHLTYYVGAFITIVVALAGLNQFYRQTVEKDHWYLNVITKGFEPSQNIIHYAMLFMILFCTMIPISLWVTIEFVRLILSNFISWDLQMYDEEHDVCAVARSSNMIEELGQIEYVLTDKTGTLTRNEMVMKHLIIGGQVYENCTDGNSSLNQALSSTEGVSSVIDKFLLMLASCHTVMIDRKAGNQYQASSPDELAIVNSAKKLGYVFSDRAMGSMTVKARNVKHKLTVCAIIEFTSARKRMSVLFEDSDGKFWLYVKGADNVILEHLHPESNDGPDAIQLMQSMSNLEKFAAQGLRTLCFAYREIPAEEAHAWIGRWNDALNTVNNRQAAVDEVAAEIEKDLTFIGATGVEDRLQDSVVDTIESLYKANIRVWMLTGDRFETAVSTAFLAGMIDNETKQLNLLKADFAEISTSLAFYDKLTSDSLKNSKFALVISGAVIALLLSGQLNSTDKAIFKRLIPRCQTLLCCRLSPIQKAQITEFVKNDLGKIVLAIGDGGNDVSMIQSAHVGVGISGNEGLQASRSADFAIGQFRFLKRLLLVHGSLAVYRVSRLVIFALYKNILMYLFNFWYSVFNLFSGTTLISGGNLSNWNLVYTSWAPTILGITDQFVCLKDLMTHPQLYRYGQKGAFINNKTFWSSAANAVFHSALVFGAIYLMFRDAVIEPSGQPASIFVIGNISFGAILMIAILKCFLMMNFMTPLMLSSVIVSGASWIGIAWLEHKFGHSPDPHVFASFFKGVFWSSVVAITALTLARDYLWKFYLRQFKPLPYHIVQEFQLTRLEDRKTAGKTPTANQVYEGPGKARKSRGFSFSQSYGQSKVLKAYNQSPKLAPAPVTISDTESTN